MSITSAIETALKTVEEKHSEYKPLHEEYLKAMSAASGYEAVPGLDESLDRRASVALDMIAAGELTSKGIARATESGLIRKITATKPAELVTAEIALTAAIDAYNRVCQDAILAYQVKATRTRSANGSANPGEIGAQKMSEVSAIIRSIDAGAEVKFNGRRVFGTLSNGVSFDYDAYGQSYPTTLRKLAGTQ